MYVIIKLNHVKTTTTKKKKKQLSHESTYFCLKLTQRTLICFKRIKFRKENVLVYRTYLGILRKCD